ncbi:DNA methyltransferase [Kineococcus sp. LSe6-4]|uniref:DNA methyltransferase n=1 Tax=Kineococcus halophytocola TaxID=3234027 RepID=A0ABV4H1M1_9ACTN
MTVQDTLELDIPDLEAPAARNTTTFVDNMALPVHRWFRYSAGFSAGWVESMLNETTEARVLDPFAGSGTTLLAAQRLGHESYGLDGQHFVARVAAAKLHWSSNVDDFTKLAQDTWSDHKPVTWASPPSLLEKCYTPATLEDLIGLRDVVLARQDGSPASQLLWLALVSIIRKTSHVGTAQWQYVLPNKSKRSVLGVRNAFELQVALMAADMRTRQEEEQGQDPVAAHFIEADARTTDAFPDGWATHVVCSPPYANNYDYADATRLEQTVMGEVSGWSDLKNLRSSLVRSCSQAMAKYRPAEALEDPILEPIIGELNSVFAGLREAKASHPGNKAYDTMILAYFHDLAYVWRTLRKASADGVKVCYVIGDSAPYGVYVPVERWLGELAIAEGFKSWSFEKVRDRNVKWKNRKHDVPLHEGRLYVEG